MMSFIILSKSEQNRKNGHLNFENILLWYGLQDMVDYQRTLAREIEARLEAKCDALADLFSMDERGQWQDIIFAYKLSPSLHY